MGAAGVARCVEATMFDKQSLSLSPNVPVSGDGHPSCGPEERAYLGILTIKANDRQLAAGVSADTGQFGRGPYKPVTRLPSGWRGIGGGCVGKTVGRFCVARRTIGDSRAA